MHADEYVVMIDLLNAMTPSPDFPLDEQTLADRFDQSPWFLTWLKQQRDGPFWHRGSLRPGYDRLKIPSYLIGGYYDGYRDSVPRMLEHMTAPMRALMGPWNHVFPHHARPGPEIEWRADVLRWWDRWLKGHDTGITDEPSFAVYMRRPYPPALAWRRFPASGALSTGGRCRAFDGRS
jgi:predicted acyl esterase